jgi:hypothetical protein
MVAARLADDGSSTEVHVGEASAECCLLLPQPYAAGHVVSNR